MDWSAQPTNSDRRLWAWAIASSLVINAAVMFAYGLSVLPSLLIEVKRQASARLTPQPEAPQFSALQILPALPAVTDSSKAAKSEPAAQAPVLVEKRPHEFARTSPEQAAERPGRPAFLGELNTRASSELAPDPTAPPLPAQRGVEQPFLETTESRYRDGALETSPGETGTTMAEATSAQRESPAEVPQEPSTAQPSPQEALAKGTRSIDVEQPAESREQRLARERKESAEKLAAARTEPRGKNAPGEKKERPLGPGFRGHSRKTLLKGSFSRGGTSSLDVADTALGRYQAQVARAIEKEWQLQCTKHRDLITPGFLTMRFAVGLNGKIEGQVGAELIYTDPVHREGLTGGKVQEGFTIHAIRTAKFPAMPAAVRKELGNEPLELIFNFYF